MTNDPRAHRPPYLIGLLCIVPLLGAMAGVALHLYGIFRYKDKKLIAIGIAGIAWTILIYSVMFNFLFSSPEVRNGFAKIAQKDLNSLIPSIEYYKLKNGYYPDTLSQVRSIDIWAPVNDPLQVSFKNRNSDYFNYGRVGDNYYLFSSGEDRIPYTKDDLFPKHGSMERKKIGLVSPPAPQ